MKYKLRNYIMIIFAITFILGSCSKNEDELMSAESVQTNSTPKFKAIADDISGPYNVLGFGYDATDPYLEYSYSKLQVIDVNKLVEERIYEYFTGTPLANRTFIVAGSDGLDFASEICNKFSGTVPVKTVTLGIKGDITLNNTMSSKYSYATCYSNIYMKHMKLYSNQNMLNNYLTPGFINALNTLSNSEIIYRYGTHVYSDIFIGGRLEVSYKSIVNTESKKLVVNAGVSASIEKVFDLSADNHADMSLKTSNTSYVCTYKTYGGNPGSSSINVINDETKPININTWSSTVNANNSVLIEIGDNSLIPIYEFVTDATKKAALRTAVDNYVLSKGFTVLPVMPLYRYYNGTNHFYTTILGEGGSDWNYEGIQAFIFQNQEANTVALYRFCKNVKKKTGLFSYKICIDHYYTTDKNSGINNGYIIENSGNPIGFVYTTNYNTAVNTVGLRQYYSSTLYDHFYTTSTTELGNGTGSYSFNCNSCYVVEGTR